MISDFVPPTGSGQGGIYWLSIDNKLVRAYIVNRSDKSSIVSYEACDDNGNDVTFDDIQALLKYVWSDEPTAIGKYKIKNLKWCEIINGGFINPIKKYIYVPKGPKSLDFLRHEMGHIKQVEQFGLFKYMTCIGIPSMLSFTFDASHHAAYTYERDADKRGGAKRDFSYKLPVKLPFLEKLFNCICAQNTIEG